MHHKTTEKCGFRSVYHAFSSKWQRTGSKLAITLPKTSMTVQSVVGPKAEYVADGISGIGIG
jgi:hypothetical protein